MPLIQVCQGPPKNGFIYNKAWVSLCQFAFTSADDPWCANSAHQDYSPCSVSKVWKGAVVLVTPWGITEFLKTIHPLLPNPYILLTCFYGPVSNVAEYVNDPKIIAWFGQVNQDAITFPKFTIIPLGIAAFFANYEQTAHKMTEWKALPKKTLVYLNCRIETCQDPDRRVAYDYLQNQPYCKTVHLVPDFRKPFEEYMEEMATCQFTISPRGDMLDCYRHWEAISVGSIPICIHSALDSAFNDLPVLIIDDYTDITEDYLKQKYIEIWSRPYNYERLYIQYWRTLMAAKAAQT